MHLDITEELTGGVTVLRIAGALTYPEGTQMLRERLEHLISTGRATFLLDMQRVEKLDSHGLGTLVSFSIGLARVPGGSKYLSILRPSKAVLAIDDHPGHFFGCHLQVYWDEEQAIRRLADRESDDSAATGSSV